MRLTVSTKLSALTVSLGLAAACGASEDEAPETSNQTSSLSSYAVSACPFEAPFGVKVECGTLTVPEDYARPEGRKIELAVAIFASTAEKPADDPVVYLSGGPGAGAVAAVASVAPALTPLLAERAFIAFDQRGTGMSKPSLDCFEFAGLPLATGLSDSDASRFASAVEDCRDRLRGEGVDLNQYNTANSARDLAELRRALKIAKWNPLGTSYGTRLALEMMKVDSEGLRSVILDSALAPDLDALAQMAEAVERSFEQVFDACAADPICAHLAPNLEARFYALLSKLDTTPLVAHWADGREALLDGAAFLSAMGVLLYDMQGITAIPQIVSEAEAGDATTIDQIHLIDIVAAGEGLSMGMNMSVVCSEYAPLTSRAKVNAAHDGVQPEIARVFGPDRYLVACPVWDVTARPDSAEPVSSDIPTLILAGAFDPSTPPAWGEHVAKRLPNARLELFEAATHGVMLTPCGLATLASFLHDPSNQTAPDCKKQDSSALWTAAFAAQQ